MQDHATPAPARRSRRPRPRPHRLTIAALCVAVLLPAVLGVILAFGGGA